jgi:hypothetical protein
MQNNEEKGPSMDEIKTKYKGIQKKIPMTTKISTPVQTSTGAHPVSCKMGIGFLSRG